MKWLLKKKLPSVKLKQHFTTGKSDCGDLKHKKGLSKTFQSLECIKFKLFISFYFRLRAARVLLIGLGGLGAEIAKNLTLSGIKSLTLLDHTVAVANSSNFLVNHEFVGKNVSIFKLSKFSLVIIDNSYISYVQGG